MNQLWVRWTEIYQSGRLNLEADSQEWKEVLNKITMNPLLLWGRGRTQSTSAQVEELSQFTEQKTITEEEHNLSRETRNCNRRIRLYLNISSWRTVKKEHNEGEKKLKDDTIFSSIRTDLFVSKSIQVKIKLYILAKQNNCSFYIASEMHCRHQLISRKKK